MTEEQAKTHRQNPFDLTKVWPKADYPLIEVGVMELNRYPENYFAEVEQPPSLRRMWFLEFASLPTTCSRAACSLTQIPSDTAWC